MREISVTLGDRLNKGDAILGVTKAELKTKWDRKQFQPGLMVPLNLSWDHRVVDGASAARFLVTLCSLLSDFRRVCL